MKVKILLFLFAVILSITGYSQKIKVSEVDKFNGLRRIETSYTTIVGEWAMVIDTKIRSADTSIFLFVRGKDGVVGSNDEIVFLLTSGERVSAKSTGIQSRISDGGFQYRVAYEAIKKLAFNKITDVRINTSAGYSDWKVKSTNSDYLQKLFTVFLNEYNKYYQPGKEA